MQSATLVPLSQRVQEAFRVANELWRTSPDWMTFFRETLGVGGVAQRLFPNQEEMEAFRATGEYSQIQQMVAQLRQRPAASNNGKEETKVITVRMPASLHEALAEEANQRRTSVNKLCIIKLLRAVDDDMLPMRASKNDSQAAEQVE
jgi:predicted HicB family RNase H-like nuclease